MNESTQIVVNTGGTVAAAYMRDLFANSIFVRPAKLISIIQN